MKVNKDIYNRMPLHRRKRFYVMEIEVFPVPVLLRETGIVRQSEIPSGMHVATQCKYNRMTTSSALLVVMHV